VQWQRSQAFSSGEPAESANWINISGATDTTLTVAAGTSPHLNNRWYRAVFTNSEGTATTNPAKLSIAPAPTVTQHPNSVGQTIDVGGTATFAAAATSDLDLTVQWQSNNTRLANGEPDGASWAPIAGEASETLIVTGTDSAAQHGTFYRAVFSNASGSTASYPAELRFFDRLDSSAEVTVSGESYGPVTPNQPFSVWAPNAVVAGEPIVIEGSGYLATDGATGSVANFMVDASYSGDPNTLNTTRDIVNPVNGQVFADKRSHGIVQAAGDGTWRIEIPWPDETNTTRDAAFFDSNWSEGTHHVVRILTGSLLTSPADYQRGISVRFTVVDEPTEAPQTPEVALTSAEVEQYGDLWFNLSKFDEGASVAVELVDGTGETVASKPFVIGVDGNTANPDGQTYRKLTVPRDAVPGSGYQVRVRDTASDAVLATSGVVTVAPATTRVFNPGDHASGVEDLLVQRGGVWTFHAVGFAPGGKLSATAEIDGQTTTLTGPGQIGGAEAAWQLDANGDTDRGGYTRVQLPEAATTGEFQVTFSDGTTQVERTLIIESETEEATVTVAPSAEIGGSLRVTGTGFTHPTEGGSRIAIKIDDGSYSRLDESLHQNRTIWWIVDADENGDFTIDMPLPNGTGSDGPGVDSLGSSPVLEPGGTHTLRFLTGNLNGGPSRTIQSGPFSVVAAPVVDVAPVVSSSPESVSVVEGASVSFSAAASGSPVPSVQWESKKGSGSWAPVAGATSTTLDLAKVTTGLSGTQYRAVFSNSAGSAESDAATLTVSKKPTTPVKPLPFTDVKKGDKFYTEIDWMFQNGLTTGVKQSDGSVKYDSKAGVSREAMAAFLYRLEGSPKFSAPKVSPFADLKPSDKFYKEITWLAEQGITTGVKQSSGKPKFLPKDKISREAMAAFMYRYEESPKYAAPSVSAFQDLKKGDKFYKEIHWMKDAGITTGVKQSSGKPAFQPKSSVTREAMAAFIYRLEN
jgi:hypothetical protein